MKRTTIVLLTLACSACATTQSQAPMASPPSPHEATATAASGEMVIHVPESAAQASLVMGSVPPDSTILYDGRTVRAGNDGFFVIGVAREQTGKVVLRVNAPDGRSKTVEIPITPRSFPVERVNGVDQNSVTPPPDIAARIEREQADVSAARLRDDDRSDFGVKFIWPVKGRISGVFGSQRIYNGTPASPHSGVDIAAAKGTPIHAPAGGIVTFTNPDLYLTGGTVVVDHGRGVSSNFLHMSRIDVKVGDRVEQGQVIGLVGATGHRVTGPHMHWGMNWFTVRIDPQSLMPPGDAR